MLALQLDGMMTQGPQQGHGYRKPIQIYKMEEAKELGYGTHIESSSGCCISSQSKKKPSCQCKGT
jgi:hypothetical protein